MKKLGALLVAGLLLVGCGGGNDNSAKEGAKEKTKAAAKATKIDAKGEWAGSAKDPSGVQLDAKMTFKEDNSFLFSIKSPKREEYNVTGKWAQNSEGEVSMTDLKARLYDESVNKMISDMAFDYTINFGEDSTFHEAFSGSYVEAVRFVLKKK